MVAMVANAELAMNEFRNPQRCPNVRSIAVSQGAFQQMLDQAGLLSLRQPRRPPRCRFGPQRRLAAPSKGIAPAHHRTGLAAQTTSHFVQRVSILDESHGAKPPPLQFRWRSLGAHRTHPPLAGYALFYCITYAEVNSAIGLCPPSLRRRLSVDRWYARPSLQSWRRVDRP